MQFSVDDVSFHFELSGAPPGGTVCKYVSNYAHNGASCLHVPNATKSLTFEIDHYRINIFFCLILKW